MKNIILSSSRKKKVVNSEKHGNKKDARVIQMRIQLMTSLSHIKDDTIASGIVIFESKRTYFHIENWIYAYVCICICL